MDPIWYQPTAAAVDSFRPLGDFVLVERIPDEELSSIIHAPKQRAEDRPGVRRGLVVSCGPGDRLLHFMCDYYKCGTRDGMPRLEKRTATAKNLNCPNCGRPMKQNFSGWGEERVALGVKPGDQILYQRAPANVVNFDGKDYDLIHEEQHLLAVLEAE